MKLKYVNNIDHNTFTIIFNDKYIECRNLMDGEYKYKKLLEQDPKAKLALVYRRLIYKGTYRPNGFTD